MKITLLTGKIFDISSALGTDIKVVQSASSKRLTLRIDAQERMPVLSVPKYCSQRRAIAFVNENLDWIYESLQKLPPIKEFTDGENISLFGQNIILRHINQLRGGVYLENGILYVCGDSQFMHRRVKDYIKKQAAQKFLQLSTQFAQQLGYQIHSVCIKDTKSRWGSCSTLRNINYSWRIALAPSFVIEYLMAHEVAHLKHPDHSDEFWHCVAELYPRWQQGRDWLQKNGKSLYLYK